MAAQISNFQKAKDWVSEHLRHRLSAFFQVLSLIIGVVGGSVALLDSFHANHTVREWVLSIGLAITAVGALIILAVRELKFSRSLRLTQTVLLQENASAKLRDVRVFLRRKLLDARNGKTVTEESLALARNKIKEVLTIYADVFTRLTGTRCRTCIKMIEVSKPPHGSALVFTLTRDADSERGNAKTDQDRASKRVDILEQNSDFLSLWDESREDAGYFMSGDLRKEQEYHSTSFAYYKTVTNRPNRYLEGSWPLPYVSTIVWPIRQEANEDLQTENTVTLGFLTVDSRVPNVFDRETCAPLGGILANSLFALLNVYTDLSVVIRAKEEVEEACQSPSLIEAASTQSQKFETVVSETSL